jgi:prophage regulatory protein
MATQLHKIIRLADLPQYCGLKRTQIETLIAAGKFPKPVKLSDRRKGWLESELITWQQSRIAGRNEFGAVRS